MAISKRKVVVDIRVQPDGQVMIVEHDEFWEGGFANGVLEATGPSKGRIIDVGDAVGAESQLVRDTINGNLHSAARKAARDKVKAES